MALRVGFDFIGDWEAIGALEELGPELFLRATREAGKQAAVIYHTALSEKYLQGDSSLAPNHPFTQSRKSGSSPLSDTGRLGRSVEFFEVRRGKNSVFLVGFPPGDLAMIAEVNELGKKITVTKSMRNWLAANGLPLKAETKFIFIPARPIILETFQKSLPEMKVVVDKVLKEELSKNKLMQQGRGSRLAKLVRRVSGFFRRS